MRLYLPGHGEDDMRQNLVTLVVQVNDSQPQSPAEHAAVLNSHGKHHANLHCIVCLIPSPHHPWTWSQLKLTTRGPTPSAEGRSQVLPTGFTCCVPSPRRFTGHVPRRMWTLLRWNSTNSSRLLLTMYAQSSVDRFET